MYLGSLTLWFLGSLGVVIGWWGGGGGEGGPWLGGSVSCPWWGLDLLVTLWCGAFEGLCVPLAYDDCGLGT